MHFFMDTPPLSNEAPPTVLAPASSMDSGLPADLDDVDVTRVRAASETACEIDGKELSRSGLFSNVCDIYDLSPLRRVSVVKLFSYSMY